MGFEYALVHIRYTIPPAVLLTVLYRPLFTTVDVYKVVFLISTAVLATIPWDSYLIRNRIWSYPDRVIIGPALLDIPLEEVFFFVVQTYNTSLLYLVLSKPTFQPIYLQHGNHTSLLCLWRKRVIGQILLCTIIAWGWLRVQEGGEGTYTGLILIWAGPFLLLLWSLAYQFVLSLPWTNTVLPIILPTIYLWMVDTLALRRGTWIITAGTKYGLELWSGLEIEEALFFLTTNVLIVFGQLAFDNALSVLYTFPNLFGNMSTLPSPATLIQALLVPCSNYDSSRLIGLQEAVHRLRQKSRSFYLASSTFSGLLRIDLVLLYSFCRVADDLVDTASTAEEAGDWIAKLHKFLEIVYNDSKSCDMLLGYVNSQFPSHTQSALLHLPVDKLSARPLQDLLHGFEMDLAFNHAPPIKCEKDLRLYSERVAGTVAQMCIELIFQLYSSCLAPEEQRSVIAAGNDTGVALQYVNIARDIGVDAQIGRVYLPLSWLAEAHLTYDEVLANPDDVRLKPVRARLLDEAFLLYEKAASSIELLPIEARGPIRVAVESYMEIGRTLRQEHYQVTAGRARVPTWRRLLVAWVTLKQ